MAKSEMRMHWNKRLIAGLVVAGVEAFSAVALLATSAYLISRAAEQPPILYLMVAIVGVRAFALGRATSRYAQRLMMHDAVFRQLTELRPQLFSKLSELMPAAISSRAQALENFTSDIERLQDYPLRVLVPALQAIAATATLLAISLWVFPFAALPIVLAAFGLGLAVLSLTARAASNFEADRINISAILRTQMLTVISNIDVLTSYRWIKSHRDKIGISGASQLALDAKRVRPAAIAAALLGFGAISVGSLGGFLVGSSLDRIVPATLAVAVLMPLAVFDVFSQLQGVAQAWRGYRESKQRLDEIAETRLPEELRLVDGDKELVSLSAIRVENLSIHRAHKSVISSFSEEFHSGEMVAITGKSGIGKTSLALCLSSLLAPRAGALLFDEAPASSFSVDSRRSKVALIEQEPHIFRGTVRQNLEIAGEFADEVLLQALDKVGLAAEFADRGNLDTEIREDAGNISGGQAQRLAIARGILAGAAFLILDEPTSSLDRQNALALMTILRGLVDSGVGVVVITHDLEISSLCDRAISLV